jgi:hypothetical protein
MTALDLHALEDGDFQKTESRTSPTCQVICYCVKPELLETAHINGRKDQNRCMSQSVHDVHEATASDFDYLDV